MTSFWPKRRVLVTGGGGFLGSHVVERLAADGATVLAPRRTECDLLEHGALDRVLTDFKPDQIIHLAATVGGIGANRDNPGRFFYENAMMGISLIESARRHAVAKTVVLGTVCAYPKFTPVPFREDDLWLGYPEETNAPYGIAKRALLVLAQSYRIEFAMNAVMVLPANLYGPNDNFDLLTSHVIPAMVRKFVEAKDRGVDVELWGDGTATREFLYVDDAANGILAALAKYDDPEPVNLGSGQEISIAALAEKIASLTGFDGKVRWDCTRPNGQPRRILDTTRARERFDFVARTTLDGGLKATIAWYRANAHPTASAV